MGKWSAGGSRIQEAVSYRIEDKLGKGFSAKLRQAAFPDHWSGLFAVAALTSFLVVLATGIWLMFFYDPSTASVRYGGSYAPLHGVEMSRAYASTLEISFDVRGGLFIRQLHHWAASLMVIALLGHILTVFFTGGFRKPRRASWVALVGLFVLALGAGMTGSGLPDDMLSGSSLAVLDGLLLSIPFIGVELSNLVFQGTFPSGAIGTFYVLHIAVIPVLMIALAAVIVRQALRHGPQQFARPGATEDQIVGIPAGTFYLKRFGFSLAVVALLCFFAAIAQVNPVWLYGPADPGNATAGAVPFWYLGFLDGAQVLIPPGWEFALFDRSWALAIHIPLLIGFAYFMSMAFYPFFEEWLTGDKTTHRLLDRPRNRSGRTALGVAAIVFYAILWSAGGVDVIATHLWLSIEGVVRTLRIALIAGPIIAFILTKRICFALQRRDLDTLQHGHEAGRITVSRTGEFHEEHQALTRYEQWTLAEPYLRSSTVHGQREHHESKGSVRHWLQKVLWQEIPFTLPVDVENGDPEGGDQSNSVGSSRAR